MTFDSGEAATTNFEQIGDQSPLLFLYLFRGIFHYIIHVLGFYDMSHNFSLKYTSNSMPLC